MQLSDKISMLTERLDDFTSQIEELNTKLTDKRHPVNFHSIAPQTEACNGSAPTSYFISGLENGSLTGRMTNSLSSSQLLAKEPQLIEEVLHMMIISC